MYQLTVQSNIVDLQRLRESYDCIHYHDITIRSMKNKLNNTFTSPCRIQSTSLERIMTEIVKTDIMLGN